ncbi:MAG TPA: DUF6079 family protein, partial [Acidimicrobiales bacterium]
MTEPLTLGQLVEVADVETVVRLDGTAGRLAQLVLTGDVVQSLTAVLAAAGDSGGVAGAGFFVVGPFGSGKSHFLAAVGEALSDPAAARAQVGADPGLAEHLSRARPATVVAVPLIEYRAHARLEDVVAERAARAVGLASPPAGDDRRAAWDGLLAAAQAARPDRPALVVLLDELSEFLRAKQGPALTEDLRFLQFLGEWSRDQPVIVVAALQEAIEEVANVSQRELGRIRDRYRPSLTLSMRHVEDLVRGRLVTLRPGAEAHIEAVWRELGRAFPASPVPLERFMRSYPLHPETLSVLEGLRFVLSQQRGIVDFICHRVRQALDRPAAALLAPDEVFDHFRGRLHERTETARLADIVVPYFERALPELVDDADRSTALRAVKLLCLLSASPLERSRSAAELAFMLLVRVSELDPGANASYLEAAVLGPIANHGAYLVARPGPSATYAIELGADAALVLQARLAQVRAELAAGDRRLVATLVRLGSSAVLPLHLMGEVGPTRRELLWQNTQRAVFVATARVLELDPAELDRMVVQARGAGAEGCFVVGEVEVEEAAAAAERAAALVLAAAPVAIWVPAPLQADELDALLDVHARALVSDQAEVEGHHDLLGVLARSAEADAAVARELLRRLYFEGRLVCSPPETAGAAGGTLDLTARPAGPDLPSLAGMSFERQLPALVDPL